MKTKAELIAECSELAEKHNLELPHGLKGLSYPAVEELLVKLQAQVAALPAAGADAAQPAAAAVEGAAPAAPSADAPAAPETPPADTSTPAADGSAGAGEQPPQPPEQPPPAAGASEQEAASALPLKLPPGHKRPTVKEFVKAGYKAEAYEAHMAKWEAEVAAKFANVPRYVVAPGRSLTSARGMLGPGARVREDDFAGESKIEDFVRTGYVVEEA